MLNLHASNQHQRILDVFGKRLNQQLLPLSADTTLCKISGFVGKPESAKKKGLHQYFFVNGRYMKHPYFHKAVMSAFDRLIPDGEQVSYFVYLTVDPGDIDVNIHPVKTEIKFDNEQAIWQILMASVRDAVGKFSEVTTLDFDTEGKPDIPVFNPEGNPFVEAPKLDFNPQYNPFTESSKAKQPASPSGKASSYTAPQQPRQQTARGWEELFGDPSSLSEFSSHRDVQQPTLFHSALSDVPESNPSGVATVSQPTMANAEEETTDYSIERSTEHYQFRGSYIVTQVKQGLMLIDQNRASQRVLFEHYMRDLENRTAHTQKVLFPDVVQFPPSYSTMIDSVLQELRVLGFEITDLGGGSYSVSGIPGGLGGLDAVSLVNDLVSEAVEQGSGATEQIHTILAMGLAKKAATPYGEYLNNDDMEALVKQLFSCKAQRYTPDGKLIISIIDDNELLHRFG